MPLDANDLELTNTALARISERQLTAFTENSPTARMAVRLYAKTRNLLFATLDWRWATGRAVLGNQLAGVFPWHYQYDTPAGCARARYVLPTTNDAAGVPNTQAPFEEGIDVRAGATVRVIRTDVPTAVLVYSIIVEDSTVWDESFRTVFTYQLAAEFAMPVTGSGPLAAAMKQQAQQALMSLMPVGQAQSITPQGRGPSTTTIARDA